MIQPAIRICDICKRPVFGQGLEYFKIQGLNNREGVTRVYDICQPCMEQLTKEVEKCAQK